MSDLYIIGERKLTLADITSIISQNKKIKLSKDSIDRIVKCRKYLDNKILNSHDPIYGVNTGFGSLCNHKIPNKDIDQLQKNLVISHACGTGDEVPNDIVRIMILLKIQSLSYGHSAIQLITVNRLIDMFNRHITPVIYQLGSLGASGDLSPLAHMSLVLIGMGEVNIFKNGINNKKSTESLIMDIGWDPIELKSKEGLALLNGTQFMSAYGVWCLIKSKKISYLSDLISSVSIDSFNARTDCFDNLIHSVRPHIGQIKTSENIRKFLEGSAIQSQVKQSVQDPYSFRCIPQVHGATKDIIDYVDSVFSIEINSVTDNPTVFPDQDKIISGGNFHGQILSIAMDSLSLAISELGNISERRTFQLISGSRGLPNFLVKNLGISSGMMITQYTSASIVNQNKLLCNPVSTDSIVSSNGQEDHVSMGANAATKLYKIIMNTEKILAIELMNAAQALDLRKSKSSLFIENFISKYRKSVKFLSEDRVLYIDIDKSIDFLRSI